MNSAKHYKAVINNILIDVLKESDNMTSQELSNIKREARNLYENLVWLQYEAERKENE